jgi:acylphosphatase
LDCVRRRVVIDGVVQGVFFRASTVRAAQDIGVAGWVRNLPDGRVEAVFEGTAEQVERATTWARRGPERAIVTALEKHDEQPEGLSGFSQRY